MKKNIPASKNVNADSDDPFLGFACHSLEGQAKYTPNANYLMMGIIACLAWLVVQASLGEMVFTHSSKTIAQLLPDRTNVSNWSLSSAIISEEDWTWQDSQKRIMPFLKNLAVDSILLVIVVTFWIVSFLLARKKIRWGDMLVVLGICSIAWTIAVILGAILYWSARFIPWPVGIAILQIMTVLLVSIGILTSFLLLYMQMGQVLLWKGMSRYWHTITTCLVFIVSWGIITHLID